MRRRRHEGTNPLPEKLRRFRPDEWPGDRPMHQYEEWSDTRDAWSAEHPDIDVHAWLTEDVPDIEFDPELDDY